MLQLAFLSHKIIIFSSAGLVCIEVLFVFVHFKVNWEQDLF